MCVPPDMSCDFQPFQENLVPLGCLHLDESWPPATELHTDALELFVPPGMTLQEVTAACNTFGEVAALQLVPGDELTAVVVFYDVRAARDAFAALGGPCCWPAEPIGFRAVQRPGTWQIQAEDVGAIAAVLPDLSDGSSFLVELHDSRDARLLEQQLTRNSETAGTLTTEVRRLPNPVPVPAFVKATDCVAQSARGAEEAAKDAVLVSGLPQELATVPFVEAMLEKSLLGLRALSIEAWLNDERGHCGEALLRFQESTSAKACARHLTACSWGSSKIHVRTVSAAETAAALRRRLRGEAATAYSARVFSRQSDHIKPRAAVPRKRTASAAEESTEAGPSEEEADHIMEEAAECAC